MIDAPPIRRWPLWVLLVTLAFGMFVGVLMTWHHETQLYGDSAELIGCSVSATVSCEAVNTSSWSEVLGVPLATWAVAAYATFVGLAVLVLRGRRAATSLLVIGGALAAVFSGFLFYVAVTETGFLCAWCLRLYGVNVAIPLLAWFAGGLPRPDRRTLLVAAIIFTVAAGLAIGAQRIYRDSLIADAPALASAVGPSTVERDPASPVPARTIAATTEKGHQGSLTISPGDAWKGNPKAEVTLVQFADFLCDRCRDASAELSRLFEARGDRVLFVFKHYPLDSGCNPGKPNRERPMSCVAARAGVCATEQGRFWAFHDLAFANQRELSEQSLRAHAEHLGLDLPRFDACLAAPRSLEAVRRDGELGKALELRGTPRVFINGTLYRGGRMAEAIRNALDRALADTERS